MTAKKIDSDAIRAWIERQKAKGRENRDPARFSNEISMPAESWVDLFKCYLINRNGDAYELVHLENKISAEGARYVAIKAFRYRQNAAGRWCFGGFVELTGLDGLMEWADDDDAFNALRYKKRLHSLRSPSDNYYCFDSMAEVLLKHWQISGEQPRIYASQPQVTAFVE